MTRISQYERICKMLLERFGESLNSEHETKTRLTENDDQSNKLSIKFAHDLIARYGDADMSAEEMFELLIQNGVPEHIAQNVINDVTGSNLNEKAPPGGEKIVKALKKNKAIDNPWAVAWAMKNKRKN